MKKRLEFFKKMRETQSKETFDKLLLSMGAEDMGAIRKETDKVLRFMGMREKKFEDFPDLLENRLRIVWDMNLR